MDVAMDNQLQSTHLVTTHTTCCGMHSSDPPPLITRAQDLQVSRLCPPPHLKASIEAGTDSPHPIPRTSSFHDTHTSRCAVAVTQAATLTEAVSTASNRDYVTSANCHLGQTPLKIEKCYIKRVGPRQPSLCKQCLGK